MRLRALHVDDEEDIGTLVQMCLEMTGEFEVRWVGNGREALLIADEWKPDLIILDVMMPGMDGPETLKRLRENAALADVPVVFLTATVGDREIDTLRVLGAQGAIPKPFDPILLGKQMKAYAVGSAA